MNEFCRGTMLEVIGIEFTEVGPDYVVATMPVDERTKQPYGILHGGASAALAESLGSMASNMALEDGWEALGIELNANHLRALTTGTVTGRVTPVHIGRTLHVWEIEMTGEAGKPSCVSRLTVLVRERRTPTT